MKKKLSAEEKARRRWLAPRLKEIEEAVEATNHSTLSEDHRRTIIDRLSLFTDNNDAEVQEYAVIGFKSAMIGNVELAAYCLQEVLYLLWAPLGYVQFKKRRADLKATQVERGKKSGSHSRLLAKLRIFSNTYDGALAFLKLESLNPVKTPSLKDIAKESGVSYDQLRRIGRKAIAEHARKLNLRK